MEEKRRRDKKTRVLSVYRSLLCTLAAARERKSRFLQSFTDGISSPAVFADVSDHIARITSSNDPSTGVCEACACYTASAKTPARWESAAEAIPRAKNEASEGRGMIMARLRSQGSRKDRKEERKINGKPLRAVYPTARYWKSIFVVNFTSVQVAAN